MLMAPPPGYNPAAVNRQTVSPYSVPGQQGLAAQGYNPSLSSFSAPSSVPGAPTGGVAAAKAAGPLGAHNMPAMIRILAGMRGRG